jgi:hypothetical protein
MLLFFAFLAYLGIAAAVSCRIKGPGTAQLRFCPSENCDISSRITTNAPGPPPRRDISCMWDNGDTVQGQKLVKHLTNFMFRSLTLVGRGRKGNGGIRLQGDLFGQAGSDPAILVSRKYSRQTLSKFNTIEPLSRSVKFAVAHSLKVQVLPLPSRVRARTLPRS